MERVKVAEAASMMGVSPQYVRIGIQRGWLPIGTCVKVDKRWNYHIPRERLNAYLEGRDIKMPSAATEGTAKTENVKAERIW